MAGAKEKRPSTRRTASCSLLIGIAIGFVMGWYVSTSALLNPSSTTMSVAFNTKGEVTAMTATVKPIKAVEVRTVVANVTEEVTPKQQSAPPNTTSSIATKPSGKASGETEKGESESDATVFTIQEKKPPVPAPPAPIPPAVGQKKPAPSPPAVDPKAIEEEYLRSTQPWPNATAMAYFQHKFYSGYRNQIMAFTVLIMEAARQNVSQILLPTLLHKDTFGSNRVVKHELLFDVVHWNKQYPKLPRLVRWDPKLHPQIDCSRRPKFKIDNPELNGTRPVAFGRQARLLVRYKMYSKRRGVYATPSFRNPVELAMIRGGMRPHPELQAILDKLLQEASMNGNKTEYMTLHARVEPDMQLHSACKPYKERNLTRIIQFVEKQFPDPPAPLVFIPINRQEMERFVEEDMKKPKPKQNVLAIENLQVLNQAVQDGLWNGRARIIEFGSHSLIGTSFENRRSISGSILNFFIAQGGNVFVGTEVSSYSVDLVSSRFYRGETRNYKYLPTTDGLVEWTPKGTEHAPDFHC